MESRLELTVSSRAAEQHINRLQRELERLDGRGSAATAMMGKFGLALGAISAAAGGLGFSRIIRETASFEDAMLGLQAVSGATTRQMEDLEKQARTLGATSMFSAEQAGNAQRYLAQAGFEVNEVLSATPGILKLATAGQLDLATAADIASNVLGGLGLEVSELSRVNDVLAATAAGANTNIQQLGEALSYAAPFASKAGLSLEETAAAIGAMSDAGIQSSRAGTGLVGILAQLADATPKAQSAIEGAGLSMEQLDINSRGLQPVLDDLRGANLGLGEALQIFGREAGAAALNVINASEGVAGFTEELRNAEGAAEEMSLIIGGGLTGSMKGFASMLSETIIGLGRDDGLAAGFQSVTDTVTGMLAVYNGMLPAFAEANNLTETQTDRIETLAAGVDLLGDAAIIAAGIYTGRFVAAMAAGTVSLANKTRASIADAQAESAAAAATVRRTAAERQAAMAILSTANLEARATKGTAAHTFALQQLSVARTRAATAAGAHTAAMNTATAAAARASGASRALGGALALVGGPLGLLVGVGGLLYVFRDELGLTGHRAGLTEDQISDLREEMQDMSQDDLSQSLSSLNNALDTATIKAATAREELAQLRSENRGSGFLGFEGGQVGAEISGMQAVAEAQERILKLNQEVAVARGENAERIEQNANAFVVYADKLREERDATEEAEEFTKSLTDATDAAAESTYTLSDAYESLLDRITPNRREARQYARDLGVLNLALASGRMTTTQYMQAMGMLQESFQAAQRDTDDLSKKVTDETETMSREWERFGNSVDDTLVDIVKGSFNSFDDIGDAFETLIAEMIVAAGKNEIRLRLGMGTSGPMPGGFNQMLGTGRGDGIGSLVNGGRTLLGMGSATAAPSLAMQGGLSSAALASAGQVASGATYGGWAGSAASGAALGNSVAGGFMSSVSAAMPWLAGGALVDNVLGLGIVDGITDAIGGLFGSKKTFDFDFEQGATGAEFGQRNTALGNSGVVSLTDFKLEQQAEFDEMLNSMAALDNTLAAAALPARLDAMKASVEGFSQSGAENLFENRLRAIIDGSGAIAEEALLKIMDPEQLAQAFQSVLSLEGIARGIGGTLLADIEAEIGKQVDAEGINAAIRSMTQGASAASLLADSADRLNLTFDVTAERAIHAANNIQEMVGGVDRLASLQSSYYQAFFTDAERAANLQDDLTQSLRAVGMELPATRDGFRALVEAQDLNTVAGRENYATLLQLAGGFDQLKQMMGEVNDVAVETAMDLSGVESAWKQFSKAIDAERDILKRAHDQTTASIRSNMSTIQDAMRTTERVAGSLQSTLDQMMGNSVIDQRGRFDAARGYLSQTLNSGGLGDPDQLERALSVVSQPSEDMYSTLQDYQRDFLSTANIVDQLNDRADAQLTTEERSLRALERQVEQADRQFEREMSALDASLAAEQAALEAQFGQLDWLSTLNDSVLSITDALGALDSAAAKASGSGATSSAINRAYQDILGRDADDSGLAYYAGAGFSLSEIRARLRDSDEAHGSHANGLSNVPFDGYRAVLHKGEDVIPAPIAQMYRQGAPGGGSNAELVAEVRALRRDMVDLNTRISENTLRTKQILEEQQFREEEFAE